VTWGKNANSDRYETTAIVGMNYDETKAFWYLVNGGVFDRFPKLKVYITHGGFVPYQLGRLAQTNPNLDTFHNKKPVLDYLKNFYFDVELHELPMRQALIDVIGADRILYGSNFGGSDAVRHDLTEGLRLSDADLQRIRWSNACELLHPGPGKVGAVAKQGARHEDCPLYYGVELPFWALVDTDTQTLRPSSASLPTGARP
jgi:hypothetical protein